jgi:fructose-1,6-bisphosphatase/inositol monophosphatase family enzyme
MRKSNRLVDTAAGYLILKESGGKVLSFDGMDIDLELGIEQRFSFFACNVKLETFLRQALIKK